MTEDAEGLHRVVNTNLENPAANVVFIHGLGGGSHSTWRFGEKGKEDHFFWPERLGEDLPNFAVWSVGYEAGISHWISDDGMAVQQRAKNLVLKLTNANLGKRPLVFIAHSMGGLEVKEIVVRSQTIGSKDWVDLVANVKAIVFCGTPHRGSSFATAAKILGKYLRTQDHVEEMTTGSSSLDILHDEFVAWQSKADALIESYVETRPLEKKILWFFRARLGEVVGLQSGNPNIAGSSCHPIAENHIGLVKPSSKRHDVYAGVLRFLRQAIPDVRNVGIEEYLTDYGAKRRAQGQQPVGGQKYAVVGFDLDGTLLRGNGFKYSWRLVWEFLGFPDDVRRKGMQRYLRGDLSYDEWCAWSAGLFREKKLRREDFSKIVAPLSVTENLHQALEVLRGEGLTLALVSGGLDVFLYAMIPDADELFDYVSINRMLFDNGGVIKGFQTTPFDFLGKTRAMRLICDEVGVAMDQAVFVGEGNNDADVVAQVGLSIAYPSRPDSPTGERATEAVNEDNLMKIVGPIMS